MNDKKTKKWTGGRSVSMLPGVTVGVMIAVIAFVLSFDALRLVFVSSGINPLLSWGGPLCVDGTILLCTWATWGFKKGHIRGSAYPWVGLVLFSSFSIAGNALHAMLNTGFHLPAWVPPVIMSIPPVALLYATHLIVIIAGDRLDKINTVLPVGLTVMEDTDVPAPVPAPIRPCRPRPSRPNRRASAPEPAEPAKPEIPDPVRLPDHRSRHGGRCRPQKPMRPKRQPPTPPPRPSNSTPSRSR